MSQFFQTYWWVLVTHFIPAVLILIFIIKGLGHKESTGLYPLFLLFCWNIYITAFSTAPSGPEEYFDAIWCLLILLFVVYMYFDISRKLNLLSKADSSQLLEKAEGS